MLETEKHIVFVSGEASGDMHAAEIIKNLRTIMPNISISGIGGEKMRAAGADIFFDSTKISVVGFLEVIKRYPIIRNAFYKALHTIKKIKPKAVILVDYPGFNLRLAKKIKEMNLTDTKVIYYISPQIWAWKKNRIEQIRKYVDKILVIFEFEKKIYDDYGINATFVGHPLLDEIIVNKERDAFLRSVNLQDFKYTIGLLPGSREDEIKKLLPPMIEAVKLIKEEFPMVQFMIIKAPTIESSQIENFNNNSFDIKIVEGNQYNAINACDICVVASGTATLEVAILNKPMVIIYKTTFLTWLIAKIFIKIPYLGLVNIVAKRKIVPEFIQYEATGKNIAIEIRKMIRNDKLLDKIKNSLSYVKSQLGAPGACKITAKKIIDLLE